MWLLFGNEEHGTMLGSFFMLVYPAYNLIKRALHGNALNNTSFGVNMLDFFSALGFHS